jgi:hypothetical protein
MKSLQLWEDTERSEKCSPHLQGMRPEKHVARLRLTLYVLLTRCHKRLLWAAAGLQILFQSHFSNASMSDTEETE